VIGQGQDPSAKYPSVASSSSPISGSLRTRLIESVTCASETTFVVARASIVPSSTIYPITATNLQFQVYGVGLEANSRNNVTFSSDPGVGYPATALDANTPATVNVPIPPTAKLQLGALQARIRVESELTDWAQVATIVPGSLTISPFALVSL
jgi:hypothetical protein